MSEQSFVVNQKIECMDGNNQKWYHARIKQVEPDRVMVQWSNPRWQSSEYDQWINKIHYDIRIRPRSKISKKTSYRINNYSNNSSGFAQISYHPNIQYIQQPYNQYNQYNQQYNQQRNQYNQQYNQQYSQQYSQQYVENPNQVLSSRVHSSLVSQMRHIDDWTYSELCEWMCSLNGISERNRKGVTKVILTDQISGKDFNSSVTEMQDVRDAFPLITDNGVSNNGVKNIYIGLQQLRQTQNMYQIHPTISNDPPINTESAVVHDNHQEYNHQNNDDDDDGNDDDGNDDGNDDGDDGDGNEDVDEDGNEDYDENEEESAPEFRKGAEIYCRDLTNKKWYSSRIKNIQEDGILIEWNNPKWRASKYDQFIESRNYKLRLKPKTEEWKSKNIDTWNCKELIQWIIEINLTSKYEEMIIDAIDSNQIFGCDMNSLQDMEDITDSFPEIDEFNANKIYIKLLQIRLCSEDQPFVAENDNDNDNDQEDEKGQEQPAMEQKHQYNDDDNDNDNENENENENNNDEKNASNESNEVKMEQKEMKAEPENNPSGSDNDDDGDDGDENDGNDDDKITTKPGMDKKTTDGGLSVDQSAECIVCMDGKRNHIIIPCGHICICGKCKKVYEDDDDPKCPMCRGKIENIFKAYF